MPWDEGEPPNGFTTGRPWLPVKPPQAQLNVAAQNADENSTLNFYRRMLAFRRGNPVLTEGGIEFVKVSEPVLAFRRTSADGDILCIFNLSPDPVRITVEGASNGSEPLPISQDAVLSGKRLGLGPNGYAFFSEAETGHLEVKFQRRSKPRAAA
jgi:alpha-glucosidase